MKKVQHSQSYLRKRKMLAVLPLLVLPFITLAFWALGGGKASATESKQSNIKQGLNLQLPNATLKDDKGLNKLSYYEMAAADSAKLKELIRSDPYFKVKNITSNNEIRETEGDTVFSVLSKLNPEDQKTGLNNSPYNKNGNIDHNEENVLRKLNQLNAVLDNTANGAALKNDTQENYSIPKQLSANKGEVDRLENMMQAMQQNGNAEDPELKQINGMLEKIMDIQHPERIDDRIRQKSLKTKDEVFPITKMAKETNISLLDTPGKISNDKAGFFGLDDQLSSQNENNSIEAVVNENQVLVNGAIVKFRLLNDIYVNGSLIQKGSFVFGIASLNAERLEVEINSIRYNQSLYPVKLEVYDMDGLPGIYIPGAITRDVAKQSADNSLQLMELSTMDPSLKAQAAAAGISAAKSLLSKKIKQVKVMVKAGYKVLMKDKNTER